MQVSGTFAHPACIGMRTPTQNIARALYPGHPAYSCGAVRSICFPLSARIRRAATGLYGP
eukprot:9223691-Alexandrium_andersonii.AAC.1